MSPALAGGLFTTEPPGKPWWLFDEGVKIKKKKIRKMGKETVNNMEVARKITELELVTK